MVYNYGTIFIYCALGDMVISKMVISSIEHGVISRNLKLIDSSLGIKKHELGILGDIT